MKQILSLLMVLNVSVAALATPDCEDVVELSRASTQVSRDVHAFEESRRTLSPAERLHSQDYQEQLLEISRKVVEDAAEVSGWSAAGVEDDDYERIRILKSHLENSGAIQDENLLRQLEQSELQYANHLRYTAVNRVRTQHSQCFNTSGN